MRLFSIHNPKSFAALLLLAVIGWLCFWIGFHPTANVRHQFNGSSLATSWVWVDNITHSSGGRFDGFLRLPASRQLWLENSLGASVVFTLNQQLVYQGSASGWITIPPDSSSVVSFTLQYTVGSAAPLRGVLALDDSGLFGLPLPTPVPAWRYAASLNAEDTLPQFARLASVICGLGVAIFLLAQIRLPRLLTVLLLGIFTLALVIRLISLIQKFDLDPTLWTMERIWDNYVVMGRSWLAGREQVGGNAFQQGTFIYLGLLQYLVGPSLQTLYLIHSVIGSLVAVFVAWTCWLLFDRSVALLAGIFVALYAPLIHYQQTLQDVAPVIFIVSLALLALALYYREGKGYWALITAALIGLGAAFRSTILVLLLAVFVALLLRERRFAHRLAYGILVGITALLCLLPITAANLVAGVPTLTANLMDYQLFRSNNLDSVGLNTAYTQSEQLAVLRGDSWRAALVKEITRQPLHVAELTARRVALFWDPVEHSDSDMVNYLTTGLGASPLLNALALGGALNERLVMVLLVIGLSVAFIEPGWRKPILLLAVALAAFILSLAGFYVIGRVRIPITVIALPLAALAIRKLLTLFRQPRRIQISLIGACLGSIALGYAMNFAADALPRPTFVPQPPTDLAGGTAAFGDEIRLLGFDHYESDYRPGGYLTFELYWQALQAPSRDYVVSLRFVNSATHQVDADPNFTLGSLGGTPALSTTWAAGSIYDERYLLRLPDQSAAYDLYVGLYNPTTDRLLPPADTAQPPQGDHVRLTGISAGMVEAAAAPAEPLATWGGALALQRAECQTDSAGQTELHLHWSLISRPSDAMTLFAHLWHDSTLVAQKDAPPLDNVPLDALPPGAIFSTDWQLAPSARPQTAEIGLYDSAVQRWSVLAPRLQMHDNLVAFPCAE